MSHDSSAAAAGDADITIYPEKSGGGFFSGGSSGGRMNDLPVIKSDRWCMPRRRHTLLQDLPAGQPVSVIFQSVSSSDWALQW